MRLFRALHKPSGVRYWYSVKVSWNRRYYSFDSGVTWWETRDKAFNHAEAHNLLEIAPDAL